MCSEDLSNSVTNIFHPNLNLRWSELCSFGQTHCFSFSCFTCSSSLGGQCHVVPAKHSQVTVDGQEGHFIGGATVDKLRPLFFSVGCVTQDAT